MKRRYLILYLLYFSLQVTGQIYVEQWHEGEIVFNDKKLLKGQVKIDFANSLLYYKKDSIEFTFLPSLVNHCKIYMNDASSDSPRIFSPFKHQVRKKEEFGYFELFFVGKTVSLLGKGFVPPINELGEKREIHFTIYYKNAEGTFATFHPSNPHILNLFKDEKDKVKKFIRKHYLKCQNLDHLILVFEYYDQLKTENAKL